MRCLAKTTALLAMMLIPGVGAGDIPPPPIRTSGPNPPIDKLNGILEHLNVPSTITYGKTERITVRVPRQFESRPGVVRLMEFAPPKRQWELTIESVSQAPLRMALAGLALTACFIAVGVLIAWRGRTPYLGLALILGVVLLALIGFLVAFATWNYWAPDPPVERRAETTTSAESPVDVILTEGGDRVEILIPEGLRPHPRNFRGPPDRDKDKH